MVLTNYALQSCNASLFPIALLCSIYSKVSSEISFANFLPKQTCLNPDLGLNGGTVFI